MAGGAVALSDAVVDDVLREIAPRGTRASGCAGSVLHAERETRGLVSAEGATGR